MSKLRVGLMLLLVLLTWLVSILHIAVAPPPPSAHLQVRPEVMARSKFTARTSSGLNQLLVFGSPYERGLATGQLTHTLMAAEETALVSEFYRFFPNQVARWGLMLGAMRWFWGIESFFYPWATDEMYGVAQSAPHEFDHLIDGYTRQIAYHGVHEVGQMFVDFEKQDFGCTFVSVPRRGGWLVGRNFDFEAVRLLDTEKLAKWVFPDVGHAYLAVTWAGMVGVVTGVNDHGVYVSINAAGTADFSRYGTPTTLVALKALLEADTARDAVRIIEDAPVFISDIFTVVDPHDGGYYVIEKTPKRFKTTRMTAADAVTNHFFSPEFKGDAVNAFRMREQTTVKRRIRAQQLVRSWAVANAADDAVAATAMATLLRDKSDINGRPLHLGNRSALDALIATHSVVYDAVAQVIWISQGPALTGAYFGFDLRQSFAAQAPVPAGSIAADTTVDAVIFAELKAAMLQLKQAQSEIRGRHCPAANAGLKVLANSVVKDHYEYLMTAGDYASVCAADAAQAKAFWRQSLGAAPAYLRQENYLRKALQ